MASNASNITGASSSQLIQRNCVNGINGFISIFGVLGNILVVVLVCKNPQLRKHCKYLQAALAAGDAVLTFGQLTGSIANLIIVNTSAIVVRWLCLLISTHGAIGFMYSMIITVFIAFDRFYAIVNPVNYRTIPKLRLCLYCVGVALGISCAFGVVTWTDVDLHDYPPGCVGAFSRSARMSGLIQYFNAAAGSIVLIVYPITLIIIKYKTKRLMTNNKNQNTQFFMKQVEVTASITCVVVASLILYVIPNSLVIIFKWCGAFPLITGEAPPYIGLLSSLHSSMNCIFYIWKDVGMREACSKTLKFVPAKASNQVAPAPSVTGFPTKSETRQSICVVKNDILLDNFIQVD